MRNWTYAYMPLVTLLLYYNFLEISKGVFNKKVRKNFGEKSL